MPTAENRKSPFWIWILALILLQSASAYSIFFLYTPGTSDVYLTFSIGVILIYWLGPRVLILMYLNAFINCYYWGHELIYSWPFFALPDTLFFFLSWWFFIHLGKGKFWLPDLKNLLKFLILGISIPLTIYMILLKYMLVYFGELDKSEIWSSILVSWMGDFMPTIIVSLPVLYYLSRPFYHWMKWKGEMVNQYLLPGPKYLYIESIAILCVIIFLAFGLDFVKYWYLFAIVSLIVSINHGFGATAIVNLLILIVVYFLPATIFKQTSNLYFDLGELTDIYLGINLLALFSIISGRVISDYRLAEKNLRIQMSKVEKVNAELDRFVYSVSHDLVAPLKSIKGLTNLLRNDKASGNSEEYISRIEDSANKLDEFIAEILDYSRSTRQELRLSNVDLEHLVEENIANHRFITGFDNIKFDLANLEVKELMTDKMRLKIILNNLISNAIKFSKDYADTRIRISSKRIKEMVEITVEDNGCGIPAEFQDKVFDMFFRGSHKNYGSGLGLFIASEASKQLNGELKVESELGEGSRFILRIPQ